MSVELIFDPTEERACLFCDTEMTAFGPVLIGDEAWDFADWWEQYRGEPRRMSRDEIEDDYRRWRDSKERAA